MPKISVIIPAYNNEIYLSAAIRSVLRQTYRNYEIIIVDDGSTDNTRSIAELFIARHSKKIKYLYQENKGPGAARNTGIRNSSSEYIAFLDADDTWHPEKLEKQRQLLDARADIGLVYSDFQFIDIEDKPVIRGSFSGYSLPRGHITLDFFSRYFMFTSTVMARRSCIEQSGLFREDIFVGEDYDFLIRLSAICKAEAIEEKLLLKRSRKDSLSSIDWLLNAKNDIVVLSDFIRSHREYFKENRAHIAKIMSYRFFSLGYWFLKTGERMLSMRYLINSLKYAPTLKAVKCIAQLPIPLHLRRMIKSLAQGSSASATTEE